MKKKVLMALTASLVISGVGGAFAAEDDNAVKLDGNITFHYRSQHENNYANGNPDNTRNAFKSTITLNAEAPLANNLNAYARFTFQNIDKTNGAFARDYYDKPDSDLNNAAIDAFGLKYKNAGYTYVVGSQALTLGGGIAYDNGYIGKYALPYAINVSKKVGAVDLNVIAAKTNYQNSKENDKFYAIQGSYDVNAKTNLGAMIAYVNYGKNTVADYHLPDNNVTLFSIYGSNKLSDKASVSAEYLVGSTSSDNQAFQTNVNYQADNKNSLSAGYYYIEDQANIFDDNGGDMTTAPNNNTKGVVVAWTHNFDKNTSLKIGDYNYKMIDNNSISKCVTNDRNRLFTNVSVKF